MAVTTTTGRSTISETLDAIERLRAMRVKASGGDVLEPPGVSDERARKLACILWMAEAFQAWQLDQLLLQADLLVGAVNAFGERAIPRWKMTDPTNEAQQNNEASSHLKKDWRAR